jgi:hypothetical protein
VAFIEGEEGAPEVDNDPDHALLILIRKNLYRLGVESITYESLIAAATGDAPQEDEGGGGGHAARPRDGPNLHRGAG